MQTARMSDPAATERIVFSVAPSRSLPPAASRRPRGTRRAAGNEIRVSEGPSRAALRDPVPTRRILIGGALLSTFLPFTQKSDSFALSAPVTPLCDGDCVSYLDTAEMVTTPSGLRYQDIVVGKGPKPPVGFQVVAHVVTLTDDGQMVDNTKEKNIPYDIRVGAGQVIEGLDEALISMRVGTTRRLYIPGSLGFKTTLKAVPGRPRIEANTPLVCDVQLLYVPGLDMEEE